MFAVENFSQRGPDPENQKFDPASLFSSTPP